MTIAARTGAGLRRLTLLRHAEAERPDAGGDRTRPLTARGAADAGQIAQRLAARGLVADRLLASPSLRTVTTARLFARTLGIDEGGILVDEALYLASAGDLLAAIHATPDMTQHLLLCGHNPGISELARLLHPALPWLELPPAGACTLQTNCATWSDFGTEPLEPLASERP